MSVGTQEKFLVLVCILVDRIYLLRTNMEISNFSETSYILATRQLQENLFFITCNKKLILLTAQVSWKYCEIKFHP